MQKSSDELRKTAMLLQEAIRGSKIVNDLDLQSLREKCQSAKPFPFICIDGMWNESILEDVSQEVENIVEWGREKNFIGARKKRGLSDWDKFPPQTNVFISYLNQPLVLNITEFLMNESGLISDPYLEGGGVHSTGDGGFLKLHADFNWHKKLNLYRRINVLVYLNKYWKKEYGGQIELAGKNDKGEFTSQIALEPTFNRTLIFITDDHSYHGQPNPVKTNSNMRRNSIAAYYYQSNKPEGTAKRKRTGTNYVDETGKKLRRGLISKIFSKP